MTTKKPSGGGIIKEIEEDIGVPKKRRLLLRRIFNFKKKPGKAASMVSITSLMMGNLFFILAIIWSFSPDRFSPIVIGQLICAIPLLYVSGLAYAKIGYLEETLLWDALAWTTNNLGNIFVFNVIGLMTAQLFKPIAIVYFFLLLSLMGVYSLINVFYHSGYHEKRVDIIIEKGFKYLFFAAGIVLLGIVPLILS